MELPILTKIAVAALCLAGAVLSASAGLAQSTSSSQRILIDPSRYTGQSPPVPGGYVTDDGALIAPADIGGRLPEAGQASPPPAPPHDGILRSAPPATAIDADGHRGLVSGATIH